MQQMTNISILKVKRGLVTGLALGNIVVMPWPISSCTMKPRKVSLEVQLDLINLLLSTIGLLTLLMINILWITTGTLIRLLIKTEDPYSLHQVQR